MDKETLEAYVRLQAEIAEQEGAVAKVREAAKVAEDAYLEQDRRLGAMRFKLSMYRSQRQALEAVLNELSWNEVIVMPGDVSEDGDTYSTEQHVLTVTGPLGVVHATAVRWDSSRYRVRGYAVHSATPVNYPHEGDAFTMPDCEFIHGTCYSLGLNEFDATSAYNKGGADALFRLLEWDYVHCLYIPQTP